MQKSNEHYWLISFCYTPIKEFENLCTVDLLELLSFKFSEGKPIILSEKEQNAKLPDGKKKSNKAVDSIEYHVRGFISIMIPQLCFSASKQATSHFGAAWLWTATLICAVFLSFRNM